jgi:hypothetical protein
MSYTVRMARIRGVAQSALEQRHALDVWRLREHVHRAHAAQGVARLDELRRVGRERRRVAGDVDDPLRRRLDDPPHDLGGQARARRVDDEDVGPPEVSTIWRSARRTSPAKKRALSISLRRALAIASAIASSTISRPQTSPARGASDRPIVPMPQNRS